MFNLLRPDVLPVDDLGLQRAEPALPQRPADHAARPAQARGGLGTLALGCDVVPVALPGPGAGRVLSGPRVQ